MAATFRPALGQLYDPMRERLPETMTWRLSPQDVELLIAVPGPTAEEVAAAHGQLGRARFSWLRRRVSPTTVVNAPGGCPSPAA